MAQYFGRDFSTFPYNDKTSKREYIKERTLDSSNRKFEDDAFMVVDIGDVLKKHQEWLKELPRVTPFFAVKCMPYTPLLSVLASLGCGFDCASLEEIERVLSLGVSPSRIVYSHTRKQRSYLAYSSRNNVDLMSFDDETELLKIKEVFPEARLLLRLSIFDQTAQNPFGFKYGCHHSNVKPLLELAIKHKMNVVGTHFHIGSGSNNPSVFESALQFARKVFQTAEKLGINMNILDIGGGFPGSPRVSHPFHVFASCVSDSLDKYFPSEEGVTIIAEPGRFYVETAGTVVTNIIGVKPGRQRDVHDRRYTSGTLKRHSRPPMLRRQTSGTLRRLSKRESISHFAELVGLPSYNKPLEYDYMYFVNDGVFTSFLRNLFDFPLIPPDALKEVDGNTDEYLTMVMGETCPEEDIIEDKCWLPKMDIGDWLIFEEMGAYTCMATGFNGFNKQFCYYAVPQNVWPLVEPLFKVLTEADQSLENRNNNSKDQCDGVNNISDELLRDVYSLPPL